MLTAPILRDRHILAQLANGHTMDAIATQTGMRHRDRISMRLNRAAGRVSAPSTFALLALAVEQGWIVRQAGVWVAAPDPDPDPQHAAAPGGDPC